MKLLAFHVRRVVQVYAYVFRLVVVVDLYVPRPLDRNSLRSAAVRAPVYVVVEYGPVFSLVESTCRSCPVGPSASVDKAVDRVGLYRISSVDVLQFHRSAISKFPSFLTAIEVEVYAEAPFPRLYSRELVFSACLYLHHRVAGLDPFPWLADRGVAKSVRATAWTCFRVDLVSDVVRVLLVIY